MPKIIAFDSAGQPLEVGCFAFIPIKITGLAGIQDGIAILTFETKYKVVGGGVISATAPANLVEKE